MKATVTILIITLSITATHAQRSNQFYIDSLKRQLAIATGDTNRVNLLCRLSDLYTSSYADTGVAYGQQALDLAEKINFERGIYESEIALAFAFYFAGNYALALDHGFKALSIVKKIDPSLIPETNDLLGLCYYDLGEYNTSLRYFREALKLARVETHPYIWSDMAPVYRGLNQPDSAMSYAKRAYEKLKDSLTSGYLSNILGDAYVGQGDFDSALFYYRNSISISLKNRAPLYRLDLIDSYNGIAVVYRGKKNLDSASWYLKKVFAEKMESVPIGLLKAANMLADIYQSQNKSDSSLKYLRIALNIKDSLFSREKTMAAQNATYKEQEKQKELAASSLKFQNRLRIYSLMAGLVTLLVLAGILFRNNRNKQRVNALLKQQKQKVETALAELKSTQGQLLQQEKMASLGELTSGIAHEIQNPLNFVNNFSEVNKELISELVDEIDKENYHEVKTIANDIRENEEKINHHGKRADSIVKGMLQHSRTSSGQKELTDISKLAEEYLRLAYHGLRAKDKLFNAVPVAIAIKTDFDNSIEKINIIPQDIGRVILNLISNAFYAVNEKAKKNLNDYEPIVTVSTSNQNGNVEVRVKDNGNGIPQKIVDKIFQPFFTTKPTGQGTGLGLSLAYDIVKAHGGEIKVETREGEGSEFIVDLPVTVN